MIYLSGFTIPDESAEWNFFVYSTKETCFNTYYPYQIFPKMELEKLTFETVTIFYGGNGTGKTTLLNIIAEKLRLTRNAVFNRSSFFERYVSCCRSDIEKTIPKASRIITSDDVFDYLIDVRNLNDGIHSKREELFEDYIENRNSNFKFRTMEDYERLKKVNQARSKTKSKYVKANLIDNVREYSNGESAFKFFTEKIKENALRCCKLARELFQWEWDKDSDQANWIKTINTLANKLQSPQPPRKKIQGSGIAKVF